MDQDERLKLIKLYFRLGLQNKEMIWCISHRHGFTLGLSTLKRILKREGLYRRKYPTNLLNVIRFIRDEIMKSGKMHGYRWMHLKCIQSKLNVTQTVVRLLLNILDPEGTELRRKNRLRRQKYYSRGPNFVWHVDSYDKLRPYGICINGAIDRFSRWLIWLKAYYTSRSSDPRIIAGYFIQEVEARMGCPRMIRSDHGTENGHMQAMQVFMRETHHDSLAGPKSFVMGKSTTNQRIECWWSILRKENTQHWINVFSNLKDNGMFSGDFLDKNLIRFCFLKIVQVLNSYIFTFFLSHL